MLVCFNAHFLKGRPTAWALREENYKARTPSTEKIVRFSEIDFQLCINEDPLLLSIKITVIGHLNELRTGKLMKINIIGYDM